MHKKRNGTYLTDVLTYVYLYAILRFFLEPQYYKSEFFGQRFSYFPCWK
jgi:hypothetical protein